MGIFVNVCELLDAIYIFSILSKLLLFLNYLKFFPFGVKNNIFIELKFIPRQNVAMFFNDLLEIFFELF